jgi:hypothetical protein
MGQLSPHIYRARCNIWPKVYIHTPCVGWPWLALARIYICCPVWRAELPDRHQEQQEQQRSRSGSSTSPFSYYIYIFIIYIIHILYIYRNSLVCCVFRSSFSSVSLCAQCLLCVCNSLLDFLFLFFSFREKFLLV